MHFNEISGAVVDSAMKVHSALDLGFWRACIVACLVHELRKRGLSNRRAASSLPVIYDGERMDLGFRD